MLTELRMSFLLGMWHHLNEVLHPTVCIYYIKKGIHGMHAYYLHLQEENIHLLYAVSNLCGYMSLSKRFTLMSHVTLISNVYHV